MKELPKTDSQRNYVRVTVMQITERMVEWGPDNPPWHNPQDLGKWIFRLDVWEGENQFNNQWMQPAQEREPEMDGRRFVMAAQVLLAKVLQEGNSERA
jgi:hypothetical protein